MVAIPEGELAVIVVVLNPETEKSRSKERYISAICDMKYSDEEHFTRVLSFRLEGQLPINCLDKRGSLMQGGIEESPNVPVSQQIHLG